MAAVALGIDLGTTMTSAAGLIRDRVEMAFNFDTGARAIPSYVSFEEDGTILVGQEAKENAKINAEFTIYDAKRTIGRSYQDETIKDQKRKWPFKIQNKEDKPFYKIQRCLYAPQDISAEVLRKVKDDAAKCAALGRQKINEAVITVPAQFSDSQRKATIEAAKKAGLKVLQLLNEPTAAATAYIYQDEARRKGKSETILVYDFGGGTLDVSVVHVEGGKIKVLGTEGNSYLGGRDIDSNIMKHFLEGELNGESWDQIQKNDRSMNKLRAECEKAKIALTANKTHRILIDSLYKGQDFKSTLTREKFDELNQKIFNKTLNIVKRCLKNIEKDVGDIDQVVLVGGSSRIPRIRSLVSQLFGEKKLSEGTNPDEAIAFGAAVYAAKLKGNPNVPQLEINEVVPRNIGISMGAFKYMNVYFEKNSKVPAKKSMTLSSSKDNQTYGTVRVFEGNRYLCKDNNLLGKFTLTDLPTGKRCGEIKVEVTLEISIDGTLRVTAVEQSEGNMKRVVIKKDGGLFAVKELHDGLENQRKEDTDHKARVKVGKQLREFAYKVKHYLEDGKEGSGITKENKQNMLRKAKEMITWVEDHTSESKEAFAKHLKELQDVCKPLGNI